MKDLAVTIWVTNDCNLLCEYCYVNKHIDYMSENTADGVVRFINKKDEEVNPERLKIVFSGGEPLLNFKVIKRIIDGLKALEMKKTIIYMITTNGTLSLCDEHYKYLKKMWVSISIDGTEKWHNLARKYKNSSEGSYEKAMFTLNEMLAKQMPVRVRMTITPDNVVNFAENYIELYKITNQLVAFEPNQSDNRWNKDTLDMLFKNLRKIIIYLQDNNLKDAREITYALKEQYFHFRTKCSGGISTFHISSIGKLYPCILATGVEEYELGDVENGIDFKRLNNFHKINEKKTQDCEGCSFYDNCESKTCKIVNKYYSGSYDSPSVVKCNIQNKMYQLLMEFKKLWEK